METEKCEFKERLEIIRHFDLIACMAFILMPGAALHIAEYFKSRKLLIVLLIAFSVILGAAVLAAYNIKGLVQADKDGVNIRILLFGKQISERRYEYGDIDRISCKTEKHNGRSSKYYAMVFTFVFCDGKRMRFVKKLKMKFDLDKKDPSAYCTAVGSEKMSHLYSFARNSKTQKYYEEHPQ